MKKLISLLLLSAFLNSQAQEAWVFENHFDKGFQILEAYDGGTLIVANKTWQSFNGKIIKLNKAGELLWEHSMELNDDGIDPLTIVEDLQGNLIIGGRTFQYNSNGDGFLLKLDACGKQLWFKKIGIENESDNVKYLILDKEDNLYFNHYTGLTDYRFNLKKTDAEGNLIWNYNYFVGWENNVWGSNVKDVIRTKDKGFLMIGSVYAPPYYDQGSTIGYLRSGMVKTDSLGIEQWRSIYRWEEDVPDSIKMSIAGNLSELTNGTIIVSATDINTTYFTPMVYKVNENGNLLWSKNLAEPGIAYKNTRSVVLNDSIVLLACSVAEPIDLYGPKHLEVYKLDAMGTKIGEYINTDRTTILRDFRLNKDSSSVYILPAARYQNETYNLYALKLNPYTLLLDTFLATDNTSYDYYCPEGVEDQSIYFPEDSLPLAEVVSAKRQLRIAPNPAIDFTYLYFDVKNHSKTLKLEVHDALGNLKDSYPLLAQNGRVYQNLSNYAPGIYSVSLSTNNKLLESSKIVVNK